MRRNENAEALRTGGGQDPASRAVSTPAAEAPPAKVLPLFVGLMMALLMFSLNQTILATALPTVAGELHGVGSMLWVSTAFMLAATIMMPVYGKLGDMIGRKPLFIFAISAFMCGSLVGVLAQDMNTLIIGRVVQGIGGGGLLILSQALIADVVPARERGKYMGVLGSVFAVSSVAGPLLGGWFTEGPGWRWTFWMNFPLGAMALIAAIFFLKVPRTARREKMRFDIGGAMCTSLMTVLITLIGVWGGNRFPWLSWQIAAMAAGLVLVIALLVVVERRASEPILPPRLFRDRTFLLATAAGLCIGILMFGVVGYLPTYLQMAMELSATAAGLHMVPLMGGMLVISSVVGFLVSRTGRYKAFPLVGVILITAAAVLLSTVDEHSSDLVVGAYLGVMGIGLGMSMQLLVLVVQNAFPSSMVGTATASNNYFRQVGATLGMGLVGSIFTTRLLNRLGDAVPGGDVAGSSVQALTPGMIAQLPANVRDAVMAAYTEALMPLYLYLAPLGVLGVALLVFLPHKPLATKIDRQRSVMDTGSLQQVEAAPQPAKR
ncbi:MDR family MFS transporter [Sediminivirga luteola]|uniref:MDR family MFS transporter n=1 Tax=Sediminivirga luteola TaxID=1774748 RepID=UPI001F56C9F9|nr:MDR family MFS transporter [Sediminivirga luteola]MCI2264226.1 MFS transporter [Sediminivirga luteola]